MKITIHAPERKVPTPGQFSSERIFGVTYELSGDELPTDSVARNKLIEAYRKRQLAEMDRLEAEVLARHAPATPPPSDGPTLPARNPCPHGRDPSNCHAGECDHRPAAAPVTQRIICSNTKAHRGATILEARVSEYSQARFGRPLCRPCQPQR